MTVLLVSEEGTSKEDNDHVNQPFLNAGQKSDITGGRTMNNNDNDNDSANNNNTVIVPSVENSVKGQNPKKNSTTNEDEPLTVLKAVPPDGGWGWVVVVASFVANFIVDGILYCYGVFIRYLKEEFKETDTRVAIPGSLLAGFYLMTGPIVSILTNKYGFQKVTVGGTIFAAATFAISSLAMNIDFLIFFYGILGGIGFGMIYSPSIVIVGYYFERWRGIATGIAVCGSGIGTFALSPINEFSIKAIGWRNTLLIQAGIILICGVCGMMFRPIKPVRVTINENLDDNEDVMPDDHLEKRNKPDEIITKSGSTRSVKSNKSPIAAEILQLARRPTSTDTTTTKLSKSSESLNVNNAVIGYNEDVGKGEKRLSVPNFEEDQLGPIPEQKKERSMSQVGADTFKRARTTSEVSATLSQGHSVECIIGGRRGTITQIDDKLPVQRDDAYYTGSLARIPQYEKDSISYTLSVTRVPAQKERSKFSPGAIWKVISDLFDFSLLLSPSFDLLLLSGLLTMLGYFTPFSFLPDRAKTYQISSPEWLLSIIGITNTIGRVLSGSVSGFPRVDATFINNVALMIAGVATMVSGLNQTAAYQYAYCSIFGLSTACFASLRSIMVVDLLGLENLNNAFGILLFVQGFGSALGSPLAGLVYQMTKSYDASFYFSGTLIFLSGLILFPLKAINRWEKRRRSKSTLNNSQKPES